MDHNVIEKDLLEHTLIDNNVMDKPSLIFNCDNPPKLYTFADCSNGSIRNRDPIILVIQSGVSHATFRTEEKRNHFTSRCLANNTYIISTLYTLCHY